MIIFYLLQRFHTILYITLCHLHTVVFYVLLVSSIGRVFRSPLRSEEENGGPSASGRHLGWPHLWEPEMRSSKMAAGSGRAAIFLLTPQWGWKNAPQVLVDVISGVAIMDPRWRRRKWRLEDVETPVKTFSRRLPPSMSPVEVWLYLDLKSIWSLASPRHYPSDWVSCPLATTRKSISLHMSKVVKNLRLQQAPTLLFLFYFYFFFNCTLQ